jgi:hypothetical protein
MWIVALIPAAPNAVNDEEKPGPGIHSSSARMKL